MQYRNLTDNEILQLGKQGCTADVWSQVFVKEGFHRSHFKNINFIGSNYIAFTNLELKDNSKTGLFNCTIQNCIIEDHVYINQVGLIRNYIVRSHAKIEYTNTIEADDNVNFGSGVEATVINEAGGREVVLYEQLNAPIAYLMAFMQHKPLFVKKLKALITERIHQSKTEKGIIGHHAKIKNCNTLLNVKVGDYATIEGSQLLCNGTIISSHKAPTVVGHAVIANNFILSKGSNVTDGVILKHCFVGEGCSMQRQFSAENSVFFANSQLYQGEACSAFCAPYTVSHHKSTLLIAGYFSFINIGSGSNQSNHMYKLGPVHQGILERGCKLSSDSYLLWPGKIGPYTFVMGRHYSNPDTSNFPFSYLLDTDGVSYLVPGANFRSVGTIRDAKKWAGRDIRQGDKSDPIHLKLLNPYIINKIYKGLAHLKALEEKMTADTTHCNIGNVRIKKPALKRGIDVYQEIITLYYGDLLYDLNCTSTNQITDHLANKTLNKEDTELIDWADLAGLITPTSKIDELINKVEIGEFKKLSDVEKGLTNLHANIDQYEWQWAIINSKDFIDIDLKNISPDQLVKFLLFYKSKLTSFKQMLLKDAQKDYSETSKTGYGYDDSEITKQADFKAIRKSMDENDFINQLQMEIDTKIKWVDKIC